MSLEEAEKEMGGRTLSLNDVEALLAEGGVEINPQISKRIASDDVTRYIYVRGNNFIILKPFDCKIILSLKKLIKN